VNACKPAPLAQQRYYRPELDVLRFFAFFLVFLSHVVPGDPVLFEQAYLPPVVADLIISIAAGGAFGVDLFFALSSFLITTLLLRERDACGTLDIRSFYLRRILRIWPLYFTFLLAVPPLLRYCLPDEQLPLQYTLAFALLAGNWACVLWGYPHSVAGPLWSVSIEEQFYLSWPLIMRRWADHIVIVAAALLVLAFISRSWLVVHGAVHPQIWCNTLARLDPIAGGAILAVCLERRPMVLAATGRMVLLLLGAGMLAAAGRYGDFVGTKALITFPAVTAACVALILATVGLQIPSGRKRVFGALTYLGRISYGLYVFHWMFVVGFQVAAAHAPAARLTRAMAALLATTAAAAISYHWFERPFLQLKDRLARVKSRPT
jgi:peptidoglycan/LPS O-acetylase OafA/YrhL